MHQKLVRDGLEAIAAADQLGTTTIARPQDRVYWLLKKLVEEAQECQDATTAAELHEELGDLIEVAYTLRQEIGAQEVDDAMDAKLARRGAFTRFVLLTRHPNTPYSALP